MVEVIAVRKVVLRPDASCLSHIGAMVYVSACSRYVQYSVLVLFNSIPQAAVQ